MRNLAKWALVFAIPLAILSVLGVAPAAAATVSTFAPELFITFLAIGKASDMMIYHAEFQTGIVERVTQFIVLFNEATRGAIRLIPRALKGHYGKEAFFKDVASLVSRRDITSVAAATDLALVQDEVISVKLNRKVGPVAQTLDAIKKAGMTEAEASRAFGQLAGDRKMRDMLNAALIAVETAIQAVTANNLDITGESVKTATTSSLQRTLAKFGDNAQEIVCLVSHSKPYNDVIAGLITDKVTGLADLVQIQGGIPTTLGRPMVVTDSAALTDANGSATDTYNTLGLVRDAVVVEESEEESFATEIVTGLENLVRRWQSEHAFNVKVKGHKWDTANGGVNPTDAALGTTTNWDKVASDDKLCAGVRLKTQ
jgi:hypothetical protein